MKKSILLAIGVAAGMTSYGQGAIKLDTYNTYGPYVTYGAGSDGVLGAKVGSTYTMGLYYVIGNVAIGADPTGIAVPSTLSGGLVLGTGLGSTAQFATAGAPLGAAYANDAYNVPGTVATGGTTVTFEIVAYNGSTYANSTDRGHSVAFQLVTSDSSSPTTVKTGSAMPAFTVLPVPEPSTLALAGLGGLSLLLMRRKKA
jgi:hypothetical protein